VQPITKDTNRIGRITPGGTITEYPLATPQAGASGVTAGADGNIWFDEFNASQIGKIST
jgi:virginiamycin B lyase